MSATPLNVRGLHKSYARHAVLVDIELTIAPGEVVALQGPNGAGKSTLIGCVCGTVIPDSGSVSIGGLDLVAQPIEARRRLRYLAQEVEVPGGVTGRELLAFHADVFGEATALDRAMALAGLGEAIDHLATTYSVGMRRRLAAACLIPGQADLYVLDEPMSGLDGESRVRVTEWLSRVLSRGAGVLVAAHEQDRALLETLEARVVTLGVDTQS